ncbi:mechanosensitive ion channel family protein [Phormidium sp. LEGE 05292]|uniref:mechanosensitive ion channel family protein n=1 Tax=[Phormidium] sp. LEGE 05292 TaxID=767427 RepID=UPI00187EA5FE|nr:mechanosensitive ion channel family protein [Phormidium sp. LEGE 05292]MBE9227780.1 mechanosensitive ion channel family protein [Phormidium sp. LEGE 05292]
MNRLLYRRHLLRVIRFTLIGVFTLSLIIGWNLPVQSQIPSLPTAASTNPMQPPPNVTRIGEFEVAKVRSPLDNKILFEVASPTIWNRDNIPEGRLPVETRAQEIADRLWRVVERTFQAKQTPTVSTAILNNRYIIQISDERSSRPIRLVTVTEPDADYNGKSLEELAKEWQGIIQEEIVRMKQLLSPEVLRERIWQATQILLGLLIASAVIWLLRRILSRREQTLEARYQKELEIAIAAEKVKKSQDIAESETMEGEETEAREIADLRSSFLVTMQQQFTLKRRLEFDKFLKWFLIWVLILIWYIGIYFIVSQVPILMQLSLMLLATPFALLVIWFAISLLIRISKSSIDRFIHPWKINPAISLAEAQRIALRTKTIAGALKGLITFVLVIVGILWTLSLFDIPTSSILAGGAVIGLAISFGSQSLIKDLVNGCLILMEDQFAIGDVIQIGEKSGLVENLNLRVTQLRNAEGQLITIPNSNITDVSNLTRLWSRVDFAIVVAYENDPEKVLEILREVGQKLYSEPEWQVRLPEPPDVLGIDDLSHEGMLVRVWIKTAPMEQWSVGREFRLRVRQAFATNNIEIGKPQRISYNRALKEC